MRGMGKTEESGVDGCTGDREDVGVVGREGGQKAEGEASRERCEAERAGERERGWESERVVRGRGRMLENGHRALGVVEPAER